MRGAPVEEQNATTKTRRTRKRTKKNSPQRHRATELPTRRTPPLCGGAACEERPERKPTDLQRLCSGRSSHASVSAGDAGRRATRLTSGSVRSDLRACAPLWPKSWTRLQRDDAHDHWGALIVGECSSSCAFVLSCFRGPGSVTAVRGSAGTGTAGARVA